MIAALNDDDLSKWSPLNGRYEATYMKPWETHKSGAFLSFSALTTVDPDGL